LTMIKLIFSLCLCIAVKLASSEKMLEEAGVESDSSQQDPDTSSQSADKKLQAMTVDGNTERQSGDTNIQVDSSAAKPERADKAIMQAANATKNIQAGKDAAADREADKGYVHRLTDVLSLKDQNKKKNLIKPRRLATNYYELETTRLGEIFVVHCPNSKEKKECQKAWKWWFYECCVQDRWKIEDRCDDEEAKEWTEEGYLLEELTELKEGGDCDRQKRYDYEFEWKL